MGDIRAPKSEAKILITLWWWAAVQVINPAPQCYQVGQVVPVGGCDWYLPLILTCFISNQHRAFWLKHWTLMRWFYRQIITDEDNMMTKASIKSWTSIIWFLFYEYFTFIYFTYFISVSFFKSCEHHFNEVCSYYTLFPFHWCVDLLCKRHTFVCQFS